MKQGRHLTPLFFCAQLLINRPQLLITPQPLFFFERRALLIFVKW